MPNKSHISLVRGLYAGIIALIGVKDTISTLHVNVIRGILCYYSLDDEVKVLWSFNHKKSLENVSLLDVPSYIFFIEREQHEKRNENG